MSLKDEDPKLYELAKRRVLALGYGCGWKKFIEICQKAKFSLESEWSRQLRAAFEPGPGRDAMSKMFRELERVGMKITVTEEDVAMEVGQSSLDEVRAIFARHLPKTLKVIESPSGSFEIVLNEEQH